MKSTRTSAIMAAILCGSTATADVTAQQVWDNWTEQMAVYGQGFTTEAETMSGDTLTISGVKIEMSDDEATLLADLGDISLTENGDGTVSVTTPQSYPIKLDIKPEDADPSTVNMTVSQSNVDITVSGDPETMMYDISGDTLTFSVDSLDGDFDEDLTLEKAIIAMLDFSGQYSVQTDTLNHIAYEFAVAALDLDMLFRETDGEGAVQFNGDIADLAIFANLTTPIDMDMDADVPPFDDGLAIDGGYTFGKVTYDFDFAMEEDAASGTASVDNGSLAFSFDIDGAAYTGTSQGIAVSVLVPEAAPFPLEATMARYGFEVLVPLSQGDGSEREARLGFDFTDIEVSDDLWRIIDNESILPRDPITIALDVTAQVTPFFDFLDPNQMEAAAMSEIPGELNGVQINELTIRGAGAEITGEGEFTFDNTDLETFEGMPRPEGQATFAINGVNGLVDKLVKMGLIPQDQAMMPRMMMGMFTTPVGDDMLTSKIEVNSEGHVLANGQRLR